MQLEIGNKRQAMGQSSTVWIAFIASAHWLNVLYY